MNQIIVFAGIFEIGTARCRDRKEESRATKDRGAKKKGSQGYNNEANGNCKSAAVSVFSFFVVLIQVAFHNNIQSWRVMDFLVEL
jgi:hypothetical protein